MLAEAYNKHKSNKHPWYNDITNYLQNNGMRYIAEIPNNYTKKKSRNRQVYFAFINLFWCLCTKITHSLSNLALYSQIICKVM